MKETLECFLGAFILIFTIGMVLRFGWDFGGWLKNWCDETKEKHPYLTVLLGLMLLLVGLYFVGGRK